MVNTKLKIKNPTGLHLRPAGDLCNLATTFESHIDIIFKDNKANAKSVLSILGACIKMGDEIEVVCDGSDEDEALNKIQELLNKDITH